MLESIGAALFYIGAGSIGTSVALFGVGLTLNKFQASQLELPIYQELPEGNF